MGVRGCVPACMVCFVRRRTTTHWVCEAKHSSHHPSCGAMVLRKLHRATGKVPRPSLVMKCSCQDVGAGIGVCNKNQEIDIGAFPRFNLAVAHLLLL